MSSKVVLKVENVGKRYEIYEAPHHRLLQTLLRGRKQFYKEFWALKGISFEVRKGETIGIIGRNGSGKSTLLQIIAGTLAPTTGSVSVNGKVAALLELGSGFNPEFTGRENVYMNGAIMGFSRVEIDKKFGEIAAFADIGEFIDQPVKIYSSGMMVRLAFAVAISVDPSILIIDEVLAVGDIFFRQKCYQRLEELRGNGVSIILVTHSMGDVEQFCERAVLLDHGKELFQGLAPEAVKRYYLAEQEGRVALYNTKLSKCDVSVKPAAARITECFWPAPEAFFNISHIPKVSNGWARCTSVAVCNEEGKSCRVFEQGQTACFFYEFELLEDIEVPIGGVQVQNEKGIVVHGKTTLEYGSECPTFLHKGVKVRFQNIIDLDISIGEYTFEVGFSAIKYSDYQERQALNHIDLYSKLVRICNLVGLGPITVIFRKCGTPVQLMHHGIANLPGKSTVYIN